jgi:hypothetical protein
LAGTVVHSRPYGESKFGVRLPLVSTPLLILIDPSTPTAKIFLLAHIVILMLASSPRDYQEVPMRLLEVTPSLKKDYPTEFLATVCPWNPVSI